MTPAELYAAADAGREAGGDRGRLCRVLVAAMRKHLDPPDFPGFHAARVFAHLRYRDRYERDLLFGLVGMFGLEPQDWPGRRRKVVTVSCAPAVHHVLADVHRAILPHFELAMDMRVTGFLLEVLPGGQKEHHG